MLKTADVRPLQKEEYFKVAELAKRISVIPPSYCEVEYAELLQMNHSIVGAFLGDKLIATQSFVLRTPHIAIITDYMCEMPEMGLQTTVAILDMIVELMKEANIYCFFTVGVNERLTKMYQYLGFTMVSKFQYVSFLPLLIGELGLKRHLHKRVKGVRIGKTIRYALEKYLAIVDIERLEATLYDLASVSAIKTMKLPKDVALARADNNEKYAARLRSLGKALSYDIETGSVHLLAGKVIIHPPLFGCKIHPRFVIHCGDFLPCFYVESVSDWHWIFSYNRDNHEAKMSVKIYEGLLCEVSVVSTGDIFPVRLHLTFDLSLTPEATLNDLDKIRDYFIRDDKYHIFAHGSNGNADIKFKLSTNA